MIAVNLITSPRPVPDLDNTISSLRSAGFGQKIHITAEPGCVIAPHDNIEVFYNSSRQGLVLNWRTSIERFLRSEEPWIMLVEDDIECDPNTAKHVIEFCSRIDRPIGFASPYTPTAYGVSHPYLKQYNGWAQLNRGWDTWGSQFILMQRRAAKLLLLATKIKYAVEGHMPVDAMMGEFFKICKLDCFYAVPSLIQHTRVTVPLNDGLRYGEPFNDNAHGV